MEIGSVVSTGQSIANQGQHVIRPASADVTSTNKSEYEKAPVRIHSVDNVDISSLDRKRGEAIKQAIRHSFADVYAVSDTSFTIYKDSKGEYVTRVRSLRDGSVAYYPEPAMLNKFQNAGISLDNLVEVNI